MFKVGCHVSAAGGVWNAPKNAHEFGCEVFQIFSRPPQGGPAPKLTGDAITKFKNEMAKYEYDTFVVHCPYFVNFASDQPRIYHGSASVVREELERASSLGAKYCMTHLGSARVLGKVAGMKQVLKMLEKVLDGYQGSTLFLLEISAGAGEVIGDTFEELAALAGPLVKHKGFGGICFDTQHAFASGYDIRTKESAADILKKFDKLIGWEYLKMSHINDSKVDFGSHKDRHEHIGDGQIGKEGMLNFMKALDTLSVASNATSPQNHPNPDKSGLGTPKRGEKNKVLRSFPLILETEHDKVKADIKILKKLRDNLEK